MPCVQLSLGAEPMRVIAACLLLLCTTALAAAAPNVVVILTDDQDDTGSMNYMPKTLSLLAEHGITFTNSFVNFSLCAPSRSSFLTGQAAHNDGITSNKGTKGGGWSSFKKDEDSVLPVWLKAAGYQDRPDRQICERLCQGQTSARVRLLGKRCRKLARLEHRAQ